MESEKIVFEMVFTEEAKNFLNKQSLKVQDKILYNIHKIQKGEKIGNYSKSWRALIFGSFAPCTTTLRIGYLLFGILKIIHW